MATWCGTSEGLLGEAEAEAAACPVLCSCTTTLLEARLGDRRQRGEEIWEGPLWSKRKAAGKGFRHTQRWDRGPLSWEQHQFIAAPQWDKWTPLEDNSLNRVFWHPFPSVPFSGPDAWSSFPFPYPSALQKHCKHRLMTRGATRDCRDPSTAGTPKGTRLQAVSMLVNNN